MVCTAWHNSQGYSQSLECTAWHIEGTSACQGRACESVRVRIRVRVRPHISGWPVRGCWIRGMGCNSRVRVRKGCGMVVFAIRVKFRAGLEQM